MHFSLGKRKEIKLQFPATSRTSALFRTHFRLPDIMIMALAASKRLNSLSLLKPQTPTNHSSLLRRLSSEPDPQSPVPPPPPPPPTTTTTENDPSVVSQIVQLLQPTDNDWNTDKLRHLLFPTTDSTPSRSSLVDITHKLASTSKVLKFLEWLRTNSHPKLLESHFLSPTFQALYELARLQPDSQNKLLEILRTSKEWNVRLTIRSAQLLIRYFGRSRMVDQSLLVYESLDSDMRNSDVRNVLIDVLLKSGRVADALSMVDEMLEPNVAFSANGNTVDIVFWNLLRDGCGRNVNEEEILSLLLKFGDHGLFPNSIRLTQLISKFCRSGKTSLAWDVLLKVMNSGGPVEAASCNALLAGLGRESKLEKMNSLLAEMKKMDIQPTVVTFGILINHLCKSRRVDGALEVFKRMKGGGESDEVSVEPDVITYNTLIDGLCKVGRQEEGLRMMEQMRSQHGCTPSTVTYNCLIDGFCKAGDIERSHELFDQMKKEGVPPNVITLNTLVDGMCRHGRINSAMELFHKYQGDGLKGNTVTYTVLIKAFCNANNIGKARELFNEMLESGCSPDAIVYYTLISGLSQAGKLDDASFIASKMKEAGYCLDTASYNMLISGFCKKNKLDRAYEMLKEMEGARLKPDSITYNTLISYFSKKGDFETAHSVMKKMTKEGLVPTVFTYGALIHAYCISGNLDEAMKIFREMNSASRVPPNTVIYNILIDSLCKNNDVETALSLMSDMKEKRVRSNTTTYNAMFKGLQEKNWVEKAFELMNRMTEEACNPDYITMEILTEWLSAVGETEKLKSFVQGYEVCASTG